MKRYIDLIYKHQKPFMIIFVLINLIALYGIFQLKIETNFDIFKIENSEYQQHMEILESEFPTSDQIIVMVKDSDRHQEAISSIEKHIAEMPHIKYVKGIANDSPFAFEIDALSSVKKVNGINYGIITVFPDKDFGFSDLKNIETHLKAEALTFYISGNQYMQNKIFDYLLYILLLIPPTALFILFNIFRIQMKSVKGTILSILPAGIAALWTLGFAGIFGNNISILTVLAPIFTIIIGSADGLHFISHVQEHLEEGYSMKESLSSSLGMIGIPMIITTLTSVAGFISLIFMNTKAIYDLAIFSSIGITFAGIATWFIVPLINSFEKLNITKKKSGFSFNFNFKKIWGLPSLLITLGLVVISVFFIPKITTEFNQLMMYKDTTEVAKSFKEIMTVNGGTIPLYALIQNDGNALDTVVSQEVAAFTKALEKNAHISKVISINSIAELVKKNLPAGVNMDMSMLTTTDIYKELVSAHYSKIIIFPLDLSNATIESIVSIAKEFKNINLAGTQLTMYELNQNMIKGQKISLVVAFALVFLSLLVSLKRFLPSIIAMVPILVTTLFLFAFLGMSGISLNLFTTTLFSITIGVGIDYAIHFTSIFRSYKKEGMTSNLAVDKAYGFSSRPIIANALGFSIGLSVLMLSPLKVHFYISALMWVSMVISSVLSLSLLPTLLRYTKK
ncbi:efflux RND transporter permease subunit [Fusibacter bizertensis]